MRITPESPVQVKASPKGAVEKIRPQPGPQTEFLRSKADIAIYGGAAGGGKTFALLMVPTEFMNRRGFNALIFRRNLTQVTNPGGLFEAAGRVYPQLGATPRMSPHLQWTFKSSGAYVRFGHLDAETSVYDHQGTESPVICFDELTHFTKAQFFYMLSRNRSSIGMRPFVRATCNPDADSWVAELIAWWLDPESGYPIPERAGVLRWFVRVGDELVWGDSEEDLRARYPELDENGEPLYPPKSLTFIPAKLSDNKALTKADPSYRANLLALPTVERERLLGGNWKIRPAAGLYFQRSWCAIVDAAPADCLWVRAWDLAATPKTAHNDPDWTESVLLGRDRQGFYYVGDSAGLQGDPGTVERAIVNTASADGKAIRIRLPQDPGQAGKAQAQYLVRQLPGHQVAVNPVTGDKVTRFGPFSSQARAGNVRVIRGPWNERWFSALEAFPEAKHDDIPDATSDAHAGFQDQSGGMIEFMRRQHEEMNARRAKAGLPPIEVRHPSTGVQ